MYHSPRLKLHFKHAGKALRDDSIGLLIFEHHLQDQGERPADHILSLSRCGILRRTVRGGYERNRLGWVNRGALFSASMDCGRPPLQGRRGNRRGEHLSWMDIHRLGGCAGLGGVRGAENAPR